MSELADSRERDQFAREIDRNFSVVASAGAGKTRAITERIVTIAQGPKAVERLEQLVVVTFTNRAADEMQHRARQRLLEARVRIEVLTAFNRAFFGTIHSFCMKLLREHGHRLGLPAKLDLIRDDTELWAEFVERQAIVGTNLPAAQREKLFRFVSVAQLFALGRKLSGLEATSDPGGFPTPDCRAVLAYEATGPSIRTIEPSQAAVKEWLRRLNESDDVLRWPRTKCTAKDFVSLWRGTFAPLREWVCKASHLVGCEIATAWRDFRLDRSAVNYDDQVALAAALVRDLEAGEAIRAKNYRVILDEAQDTAPAQFAVLLGATPGGGESRPAAGHFCMVGDFQQCIYGGSSELEHYRAIHRALISSGGEQVDFSVSFRLDTAPLKLVNSTFPSLLSGVDSQAGFVALNPRPGVLPGQVLQIEVPADPDVAGKNEPIKSRHTARWLAKWIRDAGLERLRAERWSEVAILCPRKSWFAPLRTALRALGLEVQVQSEREIRGDNPAYAWFAALLHVITEPADTFETVGVLRDVFGVSDETLAHHIEAGGSFRLRSSAIRQLTELGALRDEIAHSPLFRAVQKLVAATRLRDRLLSLPSTEYGDLDAELDELLVLAAAAEADGLTLKDFAAQIRTGFDAARESRATRPNAIQLITSHKAKGSEWQAVILPAMGRKIGEPRADFPVVVTVPGSSETVVALSGEDASDELKEDLKRASLQQTERLQYVALTRAKHTLVLVDDRAVFDDKLSQLDVLRARADGINAAVLASLESELQISTETLDTQRSRTEQTAIDERVFSLPGAPRELIAKAQSASVGILKRNPSSLAESVPPDADPTKIVEREELAGWKNTGALYGTWWHGFIETFDWTQPIENWPGSIESSLGSCPDKERGVDEWTKFAKAIARGSEIQSSLTAPEWTRYVEFPFVWGLNTSECIEGIMDLAAFHRPTGEWLILDWKTNRIVPQQAESLREKYRPQLAAYWSALRAMLGAKVSAGIYSTACGLWLPYSEQELADSWATISRSPEQLNAALTS
jgi:ATP-dependent helicase/nuclease subunit A